MRTLEDAEEEFAFLEGDDRIRLLIDIGRELEPMPDALKTDATLVRGCSASVWVYPTRTAQGTLHFLADSNSHLTKGVIALILLAVQDRSPADILALDVAKLLGGFRLEKHLTSNRTQGIPNMIALVCATAARYA